VQVMEFFSPAGGGPQAKMMNMVTPPPFSPPRGPRLAGHKPSHDMARTHQDLVAGSAGRLMETFVSLILSLRHLPTPASL